MNVSVLGIDLAKTIFHLYSSDKSGKYLRKEKCRRGRVQQELAQAVDTFIRTVLTLPSVSSSVKNVISVSLVNIKLCESI